VLKIGLIGLGYNGSLHLQSCRRVKGIEIFGVADTSKPALKRAQQLGVKNTFLDYQELIKPSNGLDAVVVSVPNFLHYEIVKNSLENGINVFVEKPMAKTARECEELIQAADKTGRKLAVGHSYRLYPNIVKMREKFEKGTIGKIEFITSECIMNGPLAHGAVPKPVPDWWFEPEKIGGGVLLDLGYHLIDLFNTYAGESEVTYAKFEHKFNLPVEDGAVLLLKSKKTDMQGFINVGWYQKSIFPEFNFRVILHGTAGHLNSENFSPKNMYTHAMKEGTFNLLRRATLQPIRYLSYTYYYESFYKEIRDFMNCLISDEPTRVTGKDALNVMRVIEEAYNKFGTSD
jgi:predicted dehydrogenase